jgi:hypothetical protein
LEVRNNQVTSPRQVSLDIDLGPPRSIISYDDGTFVLAFNDIVHVGRVGHLKDIYTETWPQDHIISDICYLSQDLALVSSFDSQFRSEILLLDISTFTYLDKMKVGTGPWINFLHLKDLAKEANGEITNFVVASLSGDTQTDDKPHLVILKINSTQNKIELLVRHPVDHVVNSLVKGPSPKSFLGGCGSKVGLFFLRYLFPFLLNH